MQYSRLCCFYLRLIILCAGLFSGCGIIRHPDRKSDFEDKTGVSLFGDDSVVAVVCTMAPQYSEVSANVDSDLAKGVTYLLDQHHIAVIDPDRVELWRHSDFGMLSSALKGEVGATHVLMIELTNLRVDSDTNRLRSADAKVEFYSLMGESPNKIYSSLVTVRPLEDDVGTDQERVRSMFLNRLSLKIGKLFFVYFEGSSPNGHPLFE